MSWTKSFDKVQKMEEILVLLVFIGFPWTYISINTFYTARCANCLRHFLIAWQSRVVKEHGLVLLEKPLAWMGTKNSYAFKIYSKNNNDRLKSISRYQNAMTYIEI